MFRDIRKLFYPIVVDVEIVVVDSGDGWDFWNNFIHNYHWKKVLTVPYECTDEQLLIIVEDMTGFVLESSLERREI